MSQAKRQGRKEASVNEPLQQPLMTIANVCKLLNLSCPKLNNLIHEGLSVIRFGWAVRFPLTSLQLCRIFDSSGI